MAGLNGSISFVPVDGAAVGFPLTLSKAAFRRMVRSLGSDAPVTAGMSSLLRDTDAEKGDDDDAPKRRPLIMAS